MGIALILLLSLLSPERENLPTDAEIEVAKLRFSIVSDSMNEGKPKKVVKRRKVTVTAYIATGNRTKSGTWPEVGRTCAVSRDLYHRLKGKQIYIKGVGVRTVEDSTAARFKKRVDVFVDSEQVALEFGIKHNKRMVVL